MQPSPYLQQRFYFVSEHGLNRHRVRNKRFARSNLPERVPRAISTERKCGLVGELRTIYLQVVSLYEAYTQYTGYKVSNVQGDDGDATRERERKRDGLEESSSIGFYRAPSNGDKRDSSRRYKASRIPVFIRRLQHHVSQSSHILHAAI